MEKILPQGKQLHFIIFIIILSLIFNKCIHTYISYLSTVCTVVFCIVSGGLDSLAYTSISQEVIHP